MNKKKKGKEMKNSGNAKEADDYVVEVRVGCIHWNIYNSKPRTEEIKRQSNHDEAKTRNF